MSSILPQVGNLKMLREVEAQWNNTSAF